MGGGGWLGVGACPRPGGPGGRGPDGRGRAAGPAVCRRGGSVMRAHRFWTYSPLANPASSGCGSEQRLRYLAAAEAASSGGVVRRAPVPALRPGAGRPPRLTAAIRRPAAASLRGPGPRPPWGPTLAAAASRLRHAAGWGGGRHRRVQQRVGACSPLCTHAQALLRTSHAVLSALQQLLVRPPPRVGKRRPRRGRRSGRSAARRPGRSERLGLAAAPAHPSSAQGPLRGCLCVYTCVSRLSRLCRPPERCTRRSVCTQ